MLHLSDARPAIRQNLATGRVSERITGRGLAVASAALSMQADAGPPSAARRALSCAGGGLFRLQHPPRARHARRLRRDECRAAGRIPPWPGRADPRRADRRRQCVRAGGHSAHHRWTAGDPAHGRRSADRPIGRHRSDPGRAAGHRAARSRSGPAGGTGPGRRGPTNARYRCAGPLLPACPAARWPRWFWT